MNKVLGAFLAAAIALGSLALPAAAEESQFPASSGPKLRSEHNALTTSLIGTFASWALFLGGSTAGAYELGAVGFFTLPLGPSLGYFGAGLQGRGWGGFTLRALGLAGVIVGWALAWDEGDSTAIYASFFGGAALVLGSTIYDLATIRRAVRRRNDRIRGASLNVAPVLAPKSKTVGLTLQLGF